MSGIIAPTCFGFAFLFEGTSQVALLVTGILPIAIACGGYVYFALKDPDKLQSEDYQLRKQALELIEERGSRIAVAATSVEAITNPLLRELGTGERDE
ncbi:MAG TPA: hypothetical protein VK399_05915 [Longimicrobiaceae bacterium]|nr:hypothetical protein [Longimicrobiaceae bacterium]